ncbi:hypothetical protein L9F63_016069, partial [Diploptera punctata]
MSIFNFSAVRPPSTTALTPYTVNTSMRGLTLTCSSLPSTQDCNLRTSGPQLFFSSTKNPTDARCTVMTCEAVDLQYES